MKHVLQKAKHQAAGMLGKSNDGMSMNEILRQAGKLDS